MKKFKVLTVVGTRPEIIRLSRVMGALDTYESIDHVLVHTGQNYDYELNEIFFNDLEIRKPDYFLNAAGNSAINTIGNIISAIEPILLKEKPDGFLILGDTNSCLCAIPAKKLNIPIFHMEAGNRCFDLRVPEEINRRIVDHISDVNLTYSSIAREYLLREGLPPERVIKTGSPMFEVLNFYKDQIHSSSVLDRLELQATKYFVVSSHRAENVDSDEQFLKIVDILNSIGEQFQLPVIVSTHPRTRKRVEDLNVKFHSQIKLLKPLGFFDYVKLQEQAFAVLSDSGTISEESSILNFPALNIREAHERPEAFEEGSVMMVGLNKKRVIQAINVLNSQKRGAYRTLRPVYDYSMPNVSEKVVRIILSYTDYVNRFVWRKKV
ncbi:MAG: UDP-N-acetylglucosamine 2-epimerase (non-hydrolyzing) [Saprospiraceae bacterium]|jgi:UDP-N-acetylglucosamine 2-epimerase (non-hydrolysing)|nr:UDP-N-acetylglucosamine 2-epimerase (non-hydrolyzing) [Saprospiraceae bacterium]